LGPEEVDYIDAQQGTCCGQCGSNLRSIALADALRSFLATDALLIEAISSPRAAGLSVLEINEAGSLTPILRRLPGYRFGAYPAVDMTALPYPDGSLDLVVHSDTLEHVPNPVRALSECRRVLKPSGALCCTVPVVVGRMSRDRTGLPKSFHGSADVLPDDYIVQTEFGADFWTYLFRAGFSRTQLNAVSYPAAMAILAWR
jgi:SAM-dependent methyltransferase